MRRNVFKQGYMIALFLGNINHFPCLHSYKNTSESSGEREIEVGTQARRVSNSTLFRVLSNFHECFYGNLFYKITRRKLKR